MYLSPAHHLNSQTPKEYTNRARDEITRKLNLPTTNLRHGSSSLKIVTNASDTSLNKVKSNDSIISQSSNHSNKTTKKLFGFGNKLRNITSSQSSLKEQFHNSTRASTSSNMMQEDDIEMSDTDTTNSINMEPLSDLQPLQSVPSIASSGSAFSTLSYQSTQPSTQSNYSLNDSLFSNQKSLHTQYTNVSEFTYPHQIPTHLQLSPQKLILTLQQALPTNFSDMYSPELLADPNLLIEGRPMFTKRDLLDWNLNDIRSLLIIERLRPEWGNQLPMIVPSSNHDFKFEFLPLDADDATIVQRLVGSDIYKEAKFDKSFRTQTAKYTLNTARRRHEMILRANGVPEGYHSYRLSKPEWRNIIENFLLNLAVEAQCRYDYKKAIHILKKQRRGGDGNDPTSLIKPGKSSLLRKAILNDVTQSQSGIIKSTPISLTKEDKADVWTNVQSNVYKRLGLDWAPDQIST